jgi:putative aminopeptidase FrvX
MRVRGHRLRSRACDDLAGVALAVCAIERFIADGGAGRVGLLATRAEEAGLLGAMGACRSGLIDPWWTVCSIETSSAPAAGLHLGDGVVVRVGDRQSVFDAGACETLAAVCRRLDDEQPAFRWRRALMAGGVCEATVYQKFGLRCGAVALPLANYHNGGADGVVSTEAIDLRDFASGVELLAELAATPPRMGVEGLGGRFDRLWRDRRGLLEGFDPDA